MLYSRCPWCGEIVRQTSHYKIRAFHCPSCDMPIKSKDTELRIRGLLPIFQQPYVKISSHYVSQKCAECEIIWNDKIKYPQFNKI